MNIHQIPSAGELQALYDLPAHAPEQERPVSATEALAFWGAVAVYLAVFWTGVVLGSTALWSAVTG